MTNKRKVEKMKIRGSMRITAKCRTRVNRKRGLYRKIKVKIWGRKRK